MVFGLLITASSEFVTKRAPAVMPKESLESFWTISIWIMIVLNALALAAFLINLYIPKWPSLLQAGMMKGLSLLKRKTKVQDEAPHAAPLAAAAATVAMAAEKEATAPTPKKDESPVTEENPKSVSENSAEVSAPEQPTQEPADEAAKLSEPEKSQEAKAESPSESEATAEAPSSAAGLTEPRPSSPDEFEEKPAADLSALEASLNQALASPDEAPVEAARTESAPAESAPTETPAAEATPVEAAQEEAASEKLEAAASPEEIPAEPAPEAAPEEAAPSENPPQTPLVDAAPLEAPEPVAEGVSDLTEPMPRPDFALETEPSEPPEDSKKAPESKGLPEKTESGETKEDVKVNQSQNLDDLLSMPIEETDESLIFDSSALDFDTPEDDITGAS